VGSSPNFVLKLKRGTRVGFKPPATIAQEQPTARYDGSSGVLAAKGRHDPCVVPRAVPIVETMAALVIVECVEHHHICGFS